MTKQKPIRVTASCVAGLVSSLTLIGIIAGYDVTWLAIDNPVSLVVWLLVFVSGIAAGSFAWSVSDSDDSAHTELRDQVQCLSCSGTLNADWRLCPHCGERVADEPAPAAKTAAIR